ncbi:MAG: phosphotransferase [Acidimicrobiales bacterium]
MASSHSSDGTADPGPLIGTGRAADVYDIGRGRVLRRNRNGASTAREAAVMTHLAQHGYPVPRVHDADGGDLVMDRINGSTMLDAFPHRPWKLRAWARMLADLHHRLLPIPVPDLDIPERFGPPSVLIHGDLHPDNVMLTDHGPVVIDWPNVSVGPPGADVASTWLIVACSEVEGSPLARAAQSGARSFFVRSFLRAAGRDEAQPWLGPAAEHRLNDRNLRPAEAQSIHALLAAETGS